MKFSELLKQYIGEMPLNQVVELCAQKGVQLDPTYVSKLRTGYRHAPDDDQVVRVLAEVTGGDVDKLLLLARVERRPHEAYPEILKVAAMATIATVKLKNSLLDVFDRVRDLAEAKGDEQLKDYLRTLGDEVLENWLAVGWNARQHWIAILETLHPELSGSEELDMGDLPSVPPHLRLQRRLSEEELIRELGEVSGVPTPFITGFIEASKKVVKDSNIVIRSWPAAQDPEDDRGRQ